MLLPVGVTVPRYGNGRYGVRRSPTHVHQGIDFAAPEGSVVKAADAGVVTRVVSAGTAGFSGYGIAVVIKHDRPVAATAVWSLYAHLKSASVSVGDVVAEGDPIGKVGRTCGTVDDPGKKCLAAHLHFELAPRPYPMASEASRVDPTFFLTVGP